MDPQKITELAKLLRQNGDKILSSEFTLTLSGALLRALNDSFTLIGETIEIGGQNGFSASPHSFQVMRTNNAISPVFRDLQLIYDFVQKTTLLRIIQFPSEEPFDGIIDITKFCSLQRLEVQKTAIKQVKGIQGLRAQLQHLICVKALHSIDDVITQCGADHSNGFVWNELKIADFSYNSLRTIDSALEFAQYLQHLNLRHNQLVSATAIKWLPHLKVLDLSYNRLTSIPQLHVEANKRLQILNLSNNCVEDLMSLTKLEALTELDLSDNCLLDHTTLLPISALMTLRYLNLVGNPLHCHPKHRLATAQFLHKNTATVKFVLDFETLSKQEKAITGTQQLRAVGSLNRYASATPISAGKASVSNTPASSVGSLRDYRFQQSYQKPNNQSTIDGAVSASDAMTASVRRRSTKVRTVEIEEHVDEIETAKTTTSRSNKSKENVSQRTINKEQVVDSIKQDDQLTSINNNSEHLAAQRQADELREKHGANWLKFRQTPVKNMQTSSVPRVVVSVNHETEDIPVSSSISRRLFNDYLGELSALATSQPPETSSTSASPSDINMSPVEKDGELAESTEKLHVEEQTYSEVEDEENDHLRDFYNGNNASVGEPDISEAEDDEATYIVYNSEKPNQSIFLTISSNFVREKDAITQHTRAKWSLKVLESCERVRANTLRINFDTVKSDKKERVYVVEEDFCQELERNLRNILAQRNLSEMNQIMYRCVSCSCQFSQEIKVHNTSYKNNEVRCPDCKSNFVAIIQEIPKPLIVPTIIDDNVNLSPASIVEVSPINIPLIVAEEIEANGSDDAASIGSATSLNEESSSCSKISNSQSSFDSNQSVVGSTNTDREQDFKSTGESEVEIISNPSISSIEVLDQNQVSSSRKTSEERRNFFTPNLPTIDDHSFTQSCIERYYTQALSDSAAPDEEDTPLQMPSKECEKETLKLPHKKSHPNAHILTESSSSGSVTDSVCTAYEQQHAHELEKMPELSQNQLITETQQSNNNNEQTMSTDTESVTSLFGAFLQSTNLLMTSSKKQLNHDVVQETNPCLPYKFNYMDFSDVDHRLKLYFYQHKFDDESERIKWLVKGRIFNGNTRSHWPGVVVMSTCKCYVFEAYAQEQDDVGKWLRQIVSVTVDRLAGIQLLPWKLGLSFELRDWGNFLLLLQDILRTDSLLLYFANNALPAQCELNYQVAPELQQQLATAVMHEQLTMCALINGCVVTCDTAKRTFTMCCLLTSDTHLYLTSGNLNWLAGSTADDNDIEVCLTQDMSNLVEVDTSSAQVLAFNFFDETENKCELWLCSFETNENADSCLKAVGEAWEKLFGVSLVST